MKGNYSTSEAAQILGVEERTLNQWVSRWEIEPSIAGGKGRGNRRLFSFGDLVAISVTYIYRDLLGSHHNCRITISNLQATYRTQEPKRRKKDSRRVAIPYRIFMPDVADGLEGSRQNFDLSVRRDDVDDLNDWVLGIFLKDVVEELRYREEVLTSPDKYH